MTSQLHTLWGGQLCRGISGSFRDAWPLLVIVKREVASTAHVLVGEIKRVVQATGYHAILPRHDCTVRG